MKRGGDVCVGITCRRQVVRSCLRRSHVWRRYQIPALGRHADGPRPISEADQTATSARRERRAPDTLTKHLEYLPIHQHGALSSGNSGRRPHCNEWQD